MGQTSATVTIYGPLGSRHLDGLADTTATFTKIPASLARALGLEAPFEVPVELGDGRTVNRRLALADIEIEEVRRPVLVALGEEGERPPIGYTTLEVLGFKVNAVAHTLEKTPAIEY